MSAITKAISMDAGTKSLDHQRMYDSLSAAKLFHHHLGETVEHWVDYLRSDREGAFSTPPDPGLRWVHRNGEFFYAEAELYGYVRLHNPTALGLDAVPETAGSVEALSSLECIVHVDVDFVHRGRSLVLLRTSTTCESAQPWLTPDAARSLAKELISVAGKCDAYEYDFIAGGLRRKEGEPVAKPQANRLQRDADTARSDIAAAEKRLYAVEGDE